MAHIHFESAHAMLHSRLFACFALASALLLPVAHALADPAIIYVTRHGEKGSESKDPNLTAQGQARARGLAMLLRKVGIKQIFSTTTNRTVQTAQPLASQLGIDVQTYDAAKPAIVIDKIKALGGATLLVGHSNTVPDLVRLLGGAPGAPIADDEFDRLYQVIIGADGSVSTVLMTSYPIPAP
ncbi:MAG: phosphoglycerate mutase family protein [Pseudomonadota bacterium]